LPVDAVVSEATAHLPAPVPVAAVMTTSWAAAVPPASVANIAITSPPRTATKEDTRPIRCIRPPGREEKKLRRAHVARPETRRTAEPDVLKLEVGRSRHTAGQLPSLEWQAADQIGNTAILLGLL